MNFNHKILTKPCAQRLIKNLTLWPLERQCLSEFECHLIPKVVLCSFQRSYEEVSIWKWLLISSPLTAGVGVGNMFSYDYVRTICVFQGSKWAFGPNGVISCTCPTTNGSQKPHCLGNWNLKWKGQKKISPQKMPKKQVFLVYSPFKYIISPFGPFLTLFNAKKTNFTNQ